MPEMLLEVLLAGAVQVSLVLDDEEVLGVLLLGRHRKVETAGEDRLTADQD